MGSIRQIAGIRLASRAPEGPSRPLLVLDESSFRSPPRRAPAQTFGNPLGPPRMLACDSWIWRPLNVNSVIASTR